MKVMGKMGFHEKWIEMIYECVNIVSYSILINGELNGNIKSSRGLRQGDLLSRYIYLLCSKGLMGLI